MSSSKKTFWTETLPDPLPANPLEVAAQWLAQAQPMPRSPIPTPWCWQRWTAAASLPRGWCSARKSRRNRVIYSSTPIMARARAANLTPTRGRRWYFIGTTSPAGARRGPGRARSPVRRTMPISVRGPGRSSWAPGPADKASRWSRAKSWSQPSPRRHAASAFLTGSRHPGTGNHRRGRAAAAHWGGYRLNADAVELWVEGEFRIHDRARWTRPLQASGGNPGLHWASTRLQP